LPPRFSVAGWAISFSLLCEWITAWQRLSSEVVVVSALLLKADMCGATRDVR
jgi:hypothetical protein